MQAIEGREEKKNSSLTHECHPKLGYTQSKVCKNAYCYKTLYTKLNPTYIKGEVCNFCTTSVTELNDNRYNDLGLVGIHKQTDFQFQCFNSATEHDSVYAVWGNWSTNGLLIAVSAYYSESCCEVSGEGLTPQPSPFPNSQQTLLPSSTGSSPAPHPGAGHRTPPIWRTHSSAAYRW